MRVDKTDVGRLLKTARGQVDGILKMIDEDRYCVDISNQILATSAILKKANNLILREHMKGCIKDAFENGKEDEKIDELLNILDILMK